MLGRSKTRNTGSEAQEPLLGRGDEDEHADVVFAIDDDEEESTAFRDRDRDMGGSRSPQVGATSFIAPTLRSTTQSREAEFELDSDELNPNDEVTSIPASQRMPLLVGLADAVEVRRNPDLPLHTFSNGQPGQTMVNGRIVFDNDDPAERVDIAELAARQHKGGNMLDSMFNMANSILGAGIIGLPYAVSQAGFVTGILLLVILAGVTDWTIRLIVRNAKLSGRTSYIDIMGHCYGSSGRAAVSFFQFAFAFGGMCAFGIIIGDTIPHVIRSIFPTLSTVPVLSILTNRNFVVILCTACISYPLSLYRSIASLAKASTFALIGMLTIVGTVLFEEGRVSADLKGSQAPSIKYSFIQPQIFQAIGVISFAFVCHHNSLLIYGSMRTPTMDRFDQVTHVAAGLSLVACLTMAIPAFLVFTDRTQGNVLNNFPQDDAVINIARFCFGANMVTTTPMELMVCREVIEEYFFAHEAFDQTRHVLFTTSILFASMAVALVTCDLGVMLEITGGASATALAFVFPALCYIKLLPAREPWNGRAKLPAVLCAGFGILVLVLSVGLALQKAWGPEGATRLCA
ncbi:Transmembrane amino acid transporter protein [Rhizoctonia solani]|uniref:Transmembrane amino acid transporter protein n=1 Tax=Rhizoctonia solani TaxID=456999 RepID=A0A8H8NXN7_9AGAM|nr:Transmembrane amino acid transporter protein [Rhizoctonia solani]QRW21430.1 Transmembrane amino acid transporter protein [Rhizoctonia solani]